MNKKYFSPTVEIKHWELDVLLISGDNFLDWGDFGKEEQGTEV